MIHVAYRLWGGDGFFAKMLAVSMLSMFENTKESVTVHVMHNYRLTSENRNIFCYIAQKYNQHIEFHNVEEISGETLKKFDEAHPTNTTCNVWWYSLIIHEVFPNLDKIIFFGADTVVNLDIGDLWAYDLGDYGIGAAVDINVPKERLPLCMNGYVEHKNWFNVDVMLMKPSFIAENLDALIDALKFIYEKKYPFFDNDALNYLFSEKYLKLPYRFNSIVYDIRTFTPSPHKIEKAIYHFAGSKPDLNTDDVFNRLYLEYFLKTPYATVDMFGNLDKAFKKNLNSTLDESRNSLLYFTNLLTRRKRAFFVDTKNLDAIRQIFEIKDDELVIEASDVNSAGNLLVAMKESQGKQIFFILFDNYFALRNALIQRGFVENQDFVNIFSFLSEKHGMKFNFATQEIVKEM